MINNELNILLVGVGGQGTVFASKMLAAAALAQGLTVRTAETIGMAQRGGSVVSHVRIGEEAYSPFIPQGTAQMIIAFEPAEAVRVLSYGTQDSLLVVCDSALKPVTSSLAEDSYQSQAMIDYLRGQGRNPLVVEGDAVRQRCGSLKALNMVLLGAAVQSGFFPFSTKDLERLLRLKVPARFMHLNLTALALGSALWEARPHS